jgi:hypothetical protein
MNIANNLTMDGTAYSVTNEYMSVDKFEFLPKFIFNKPVLYDIVGGNINTGMVAYAYQLYIVNGAETAFSAVSDPIHVVSDNDSLASTLNYNGSPNEESSGKGFLLKIVNSNTGYNRLRLIRIEYHNINQIPIIYIANEIEIGAEPATIYITDTGEVHGEITLDEFNITSTELFKCKDIATKDNRLFVTNVTKSEYIVDPTWDARAVRFDNTGIAYIHDTTVGTSAVTLATWAAVYTSEHDGINKFNDPDNDGDGDFKWIYQSDGATLGAEGPNVKIDFETEPFVLDNSNNDSTFYVDAPTNATDLSYKNYASPWKAGKLSWQRDETYRLFVVFGNDRGQISEPKWICDLRMPSFHDDTFSNSAGSVYPWRLAGDNGDGTIYANRLYPRILFKNFPTNASWAQVHRVKRERKDRSVVTQGLAMGSFQDKADGIAYRVGNQAIPNVHDLFVMNDDSGGAPIKCKKKYSTKI